ncbi:hypothetical protein [Neglectibacter sp. X4]|nr:hypothetical protein [Neglectibacter sp. X4]
MTGRNTGRIGVKENNQSEKEAVFIMITNGDKVIMNEKYHVTEKNKNKVFLVSSSPFEVCGQMCVMLEGYTGCYALDGLKKVKGGTEDA